MSQAENVYDTFEKCGLNLPIHIKNLLQKLGYSSLRSFAQEHPIDNDKLQEIEDNIRMHVASASMINKLEKHENSSAEKINLFGELFYENPKQFTFLPGERSSIISAVELCASILKENKIPVLQVNSMFRKHSSVASSLAATRPQLAIDTTKGNAQQFLTSSNAAGMNQLPTSKGRSLLEAASNNWVQRFKQTNNLNYTLEDFTVCEETRKIVCEHKDHFKATTIRMVFDDKGYWKISNFSRHVTVSRLKIKHLS